jgi:hypothetical protein
LSLQISFFSPPFLTSSFYSGRSLQDKEPLIGQNP